MRPLGWLWLRKKEGLRSERGREWIFAFVKIQASDCRQLCILVRSGVWWNNIQSHLLLPFCSEGRIWKKKKCFSRLTRITQIVQYLTEWIHTRLKNVKWMTLLSLLENEISLPWKLVGAIELCVIIGVLMCWRALIPAYLHQKQLGLQLLLYSLSLSWKWGLYLYLQLSAKCYHNSLWE